MARHRSARGRTGPIAGSTAVMGLAVALGIVGGYSLYHELSARSSSAIPGSAPAKVVQQASASPSPLLVKAPNSTCHLVILDKGRNSIVKDLAPGEIFEFQQQEFQGTACAGAEIYINGARQTPTPIPSTDRVRFAS